jgi:hypothetical protein
MAKQKTKPIKTKKSFTKTTPADVYARATAILNGVYADPIDYPSPPIPVADFKADVDTYSVKITAALDGGKKAIAERNHQGEILIKAIRQLGHYVDMTGKEDMPTFLKSGFEAASTTKGTAQPLSQFIRKITAGPNAGQFQVAVAAVPGALSYELRSAPVGAGGTLGTFTNQPVGKTRPPATVTGLTPGLTYSIQVRAVTKAGYTDWSDPITRVCT